MMSSVIGYLKDPHLVARIQKYYGIVVVEPPKWKSSTLTSGVGDTVKNRMDKGCTKPKTRFENKLVEGSNVYNSSINCDTKEYINGIGSNGYISSEPDDDETFSSESEPESKGYVVTNWMWYYLFVLGTALGDEIFYASFIPFWFWNIDGAVGRRVVLVWTVIMYIGQGIKDVVRWPRPSCPPVVRLQVKWALEYGMPSTHAMVGVSIPLSVILYTMNRYQYSVSLGVLFAIGWCSVICLSRLYLGMHSVLMV